MSSGRGFTRKTLSVSVFGSALRNLDLGSVAVGAAGELGRLGADTVESFLRLVGEQAL